MYSIFVILVELLSSLFKKLVSTNKGLSFPVVSNVIILLLSSSKGKLALIP